MDLTQKQQEILDAVHSKRNVLVTGPAGCGKSYVIQAVIKEYNKGCAATAMTGIAGSANIGSNVMTGGQVGIAGHLKIGSNVQIAAQSGVLKDIENDSSVMGHPAIDKIKYIRKYKKNYA